VFGLVALAVVVAWGARRRKTLREAEQLVAAIPVGVKAPDGERLVGPDAPSGPPQPPKV
jgi:hypothetical protein